MRGDLVRPMASYSGYGLSVGQEITLLGFFSVNLKKALDGSSGANSKANAVPVKDAVEFFVLGRFAKYFLPPEENHD